MIDRVHWISKEKLIKFILDCQVDRSSSFLSQLIQIQQKQLAAASAFDEQLKCFRECVSTLGKLFSFSSSIDNSTVYTCSIVPNQLATYKCMWQQKNRMEILGIGAFPDGEWEWFRRMFDIEEHDDSPQLLGEDDMNFGMQIQSMFCSTPEAGGNKSMFYSFDYNNSNLQYVSQESSHGSNCSDHTVFVANPSHTNYCFDYPDDHVLASNYSDRSENSHHSQVEPIVFPTKQLKLKRMLDVPELEVHVEDKINSCGNPKKKLHASKEVQRCMKNAGSKKSQKVDIHGNEAEEINAGSDGQSSSSYHTSEEHNMSEENSGGATLASKLNGKTRASRGSATDPQSLYARKRRERINERLRILQNLVPNGTKVDISTMLEEAVHYVKFLQLQIKLLSSDDLWMYAPLAYNGLDIGSLNLSQKISPPL